MNSFQKLQQQMKNMGLIDESILLKEKIECGYTTSSEMYGELGAAIKNIYLRLTSQKQKELHETFSECVIDIQKVWKTYKL